MKTLVSALAFASFATLTFAQGTVNFDTKAVLARVYNYNDTFDATGASTASTVLGTAFWMQLYAVDGTGGAEGSLVAVGSPVNARAGINAGYSLTGAPANPVVTVTPVSGGAVTLQVRVWSATYATYAAAVTAWEGGAQGATYGKSGIISLASTGSTLVTPPNLTGLTSFQMVAPVPEPATLALAGIGGLGLLALRRKQA
jgi:hypothetical protein